MIIKMLHLGGEVIIGTVLSDSNDSITIERPIALIPNPFQGGIMLMQPHWSVVTMQTKFTFNKSTIHFIEDVRADMEKNYLGAVSEIAAALLNPPDPLAQGGSIKGKGGLSLLK
jgi:hypothetical protein